VIEASPTAPATAGTRLVATEGVAKRFGAIQALDGVTVTIDEPATGLLGANGAGKSTLMKALLGLVPPDEGRVEVLGIDAARHPGEIRRRLGYMPELDCLPLDMTARDLVVHMAELRGLPRRAAVLRASEVLFQVGLEEERSRLIRTFSTGMKQRTKLAQAIVHSPELVVLDEPTNGLDPAGIVEIRGLLTDLGAQGRTVVVSSHLLSEIQAACDHLVVIRYGELLFNGPTVELMARSHEHVDVAPEDPGAAEPLAALLHGHGWTGEPTGDVLRLRVHARDSAAVNRAAADAGITLRLLQPARETLEDVFLRMTGPDASPGAASEGRGTR
jgi:ABC-2 type transport system ATP-binding protein